MNQETNVMCDLETLGLAPGCMILSIGAVKFDPITKTLGDEFHCRISMEDSSSHGFGMDISTVRWWLTQSDSAKMAAMSKEEALPVVTALAMFFGFCTGMTKEQMESTKDMQVFTEATKPVKMWGNGASFDNAILSAYYRRMQIIQPWMFYNDCCYRTVKNAYPSIKLTRVGTHHNALDDAKSQALHLMEIIKVTNYGGYNGSAKG